MTGSRRNGVAVTSALGLSVSAGGRPLLAGVEFALGPGELAGVLGPSGCGKTTLLRAMAGLIDWDEGEVLFEGLPPKAMGWPAYRRKVLLVDQRPALLECSVEENLARPFSYRVAEGPFPSDRARVLLERLGVSPDQLGQPAQSLSEGEQQRVCIARALLLEPAVLLLDEPTGALDKDHALDVEAFVRDAADETGLCALVVTHDEDQAARWCGRSIDLRPWMAIPAGKEAAP